MKKYFLISLGTLLFISTAYAVGSIPKNLTDQIHQLLKRQYQTYRKTEYFSGIMLSVSLPRKNIENFYIGNISHEKNATQINKKNLIEIGSISKSFTAALILKLIQQHKLKLSDTVGQFLPEYKKWGYLMISQLLNMTSGLPNYSDTPAWNYLEERNTRRIWEKKDLINFVYPKLNFNPPLKKSYFYTNTGYLLAAMIIEKVTGKSFKSVLMNKIIQPLNLKHTFYPIPESGKHEKRYLIHGYGYNQYANPGLVGHDIKSNNLSWAGAAGGIVSNTEEIIKWVRYLFIEHKLLTDKQQKTLMQLNAIDTTKPINQTSTQHPRAFALGVIQAYQPKIGRYWFYEGETLGFRTFYIYTPCNKIILAASYNSATNSENDHGHILLQQTYQTILKNYPKLKCRS